MLYLVYKTTNTINGKIYIGIHKQKNENFDGYYGSGLLLHLAIKKYGIENFFRETLFIYDNMDLARKKEKELVTKEFCESRNNYNISVGGMGGNTLAGHGDERRKKIQEKRKETNLFRENYTYIGKKLEAARKRMLNCRIQPSNKDRKHIGKALENMRLSAQKRTGKFFWITNGKISKLVLKHDVLPEGYYPGRGEDMPKFIRHTEETKEKIAKKIMGDVCYNNGKVNLKLKIGQQPPEGYVRGMIQNHTWKWITNGSDTKKIHKNEPIPNGWKNGRSFQKGSANE